MYSTSSRDDNLGVLPVAAIAGAASGAINVFKSIFGGGGISDKDKNRLAVNQRAYDYAMNGDTRAVEYLKYRSGRFGISKPMNLGDLTDNQTVPVGGWASTLGKDDAYTKYQQVLAAYKSAGKSPTPAPASSAKPSQAGFGPVAAVALAGLAAFALSKRK